MKQSQFSAVVVILTIFYVVNIECYYRPSQCGINEEYVCKNLDCVSTCQNPNRNGVCENCTLGCYCQDNYWRNEETGKCVPMSKCPCKNGRVFRYSNPCIDSCDSEICPQYAEAGCFCPQRQCTNKEGVCIPKPPRNNK